MPVTVDPLHNFMQGLSDFWAASFRDLTHMEAMHEGTQVLVGQAYLDLLHEVLGTSLQHAPLFDKKYYRLLLIREDEIAFSEGASVDDDRYLLRDDEQIEGAPLLLNKVILPTRVMEDRVDYDVSGGQVRFRVDPFNAGPVVTLQDNQDVNFLTGLNILAPVVVGDTVNLTAGLPEAPATFVVTAVRPRELDVAPTTPFSVATEEQVSPSVLTYSVGDNSPLFNNHVAPIIGTAVTTRRQESLGTSAALYPVRSVEATFPSSVRNLQSEAWVTFGVRPGDALQLRIENAPAVESVIRFVDGSDLRLAALAEEHRLDLRSRTVHLTILRTPHDHEKRGIPTPGQARAYQAIVAAPVTATSTILAPGAIASWVGQYVYLDDSGAPTNSGFYRVNSVVVGISATLARTTPFLLSFGPFLTLLVDHGPMLTDAPRAVYTQQHIDPGTVVISGRRVVPRGPDHPVGGNVEEGVDFAIDYEEGAITYLSVWDPLFPSTSSFNWRLRVARVTYLLRNDLAPGGVWVSLAAYSFGDVVQFPAGSGTYYVALEASADLVFDPEKWALYDKLFDLDATSNVRELAAWATDMLLDRERLYTTFGYLLGYRKPSSEQYRALLRGVAQLFVLGPTLERIESALNVMAGYPVIRDDGEVLQGFESAYRVVSTLPDVRQGDGGRIYDFNYGRNGNLVLAGSQFQSPDAGFLASDVGAVVRVAVGSSVREFFVTSVVGPTAAVVSPAVLADEFNVRWEYSHVEWSKRFVVDSPNVTYVFSQDDVDGAIVVQDAVNPGNSRSFRILAVESPRTLVLESEFRLVDESGLSWRVTRTRTHQVSTSRDAYFLPAEAPVRPELTDPANFNVLVLHAFEALTTAIEVVDYIRDPTWWRNVVIPREVLQLADEDPGRRVVGPQLIPNSALPLDQARVGDPGLLIGRDDEGRPGIERAGPATWLGGPWVRLDFPPPVPKARATDPRTYLTVSSGDFAGSFQILEVNTAGDEVRLDRFPPPAAAAHLPPEALPSVALPPILLRRTVPFVMMDRFLQWHAFTIRIDTNGALSPEFIDEAAGLIQQAKAGYTFAYLEPTTSFRDELTIAELFEVAYGPEWVERFLAILNELRVGTEVLVGEWHFYLTSFQAGVQGAPGPLAFVMTPVFPYVPDRHRFVFARFSSGTAAGVRLSEGVHYAINYATGAVAAPLVDAGPWQIEYVACGLKVHAALAPWWTTPGFFPGETPLAVAGTDPLVRVNPGMTLVDLGVVDRAVEITIGP